MNWKQKPSPVEDLEIEIKHLEIKLFIVTHQYHVTSAIRNIAATNITILNKIFTLIL